MSKNVKLMIALGAAVATGSGATAMLLGGGESWFSDTVLVWELPNESTWFNGLSDFNNDGNPDFVSFTPPNSWVGNAGLWMYAGLGNGQFDDGSFMPIENWPLDDDSGVDYEPSGETGAWAADVNQDGWNDLILAFELYGLSNPNPEFLVTFLNTGGGGFVCAGDINGNGETEIDDLLQLISDFGCTEGDPLN